jgi:integrase/recombinase XerC
MQEFINYLVNQDRSPATIRAYGQDLAKFSGWFQQINGYPLTAQDLTPTDIRQFREYLNLTERLAPASINRILAAIRAYTAWLVDTGQVDYNPARGITGITEQAHAPKWLDKRNQDKLIRSAERALSASQTELEKARAVRDYAIILVMLNTGLRVSELVGLVDHDITIKDRSGDIRVIGKGRKARTIPLNKTARDALTDWLALGRVSDRVFPITTRGIQDMLSELGRLARVDVTPHVLRHTFAKNLIDSGVSIEKVAALLGHSSLETTRIYITPSAHDLAQAVVLLE